MTLTAWLLATGSHWDLVQTFAWGRMIAAYSQSMPMTKAIRMTFTAENLCGVCEWVQDAQTAESGEAPPGKLDLKVQLAFEAIPTVLAPAGQASPWKAIDSPLPVRLRAAPPTPPPQAA